MQLRLNKIVGPYYCQMALGLCMEARQLCTMGDCKKVSEICSLVSTLCQGKDFETCYKESSICKQVSTYCLDGRNSNGCHMARLACDEARRICSQNNLIHGG